MILVAVCGLFAFPASAQEDRCFPRNDLTERLSSKYSETPRAAGLEATGKLLELYTTPDGSTWTLTVVTPDGTSCVVAVGEHWQSWEAAKPMSAPL